MKPELKNKLKVYASLTGCALLSQEATAMSSYTYVNLNCTDANWYVNGNPNNTIPDYLIDIDNDGVDDFRLVNNRNSTGPWGTCFDNSFKIYGLGNNQIAGNSGYVYNLPASYFINSSLNFIQSGFLINSSGCRSYSWNYGASFCNKYGNWIDEKEMGFIAIRLDNHPGWMRLGVRNYNGSFGVVIVDYEIPTLVTPKIKTAQVDCPIGVYDVSNNNNGSDLRIQANTQYYSDINCKEYKFFIVKEEYSSLFGINEALTNPYYISKAPQSSLYFNASSNSRDTNGDLIIENQPYKVFVLSIADGVIATENLLSCPSASITLTGSIVLASQASNLNAQDISNNGDASDLRVTFSKASDESTIGEYRAFVVKDGTSFSLANAESNSNYKVIVPNGSSQYTLNYLANDTDTNGDIIIENQDYRAYILSMADGTNASANSLSNASNKVTLTQPIIVSSVASNIVASDISNNKNASDLEVIFNKATNENTVDEYRVFVCKYSNTFNINDAENNSNFRTINPNNLSQYTVNFLANDLDTDGDIIVEDVWYKVYVMSVADGTNANTNSLSNPSNNVKLTSPVVGLKENTQTFGTFYKNNQLNINVDNTLVGADIEVVNLLGEKVLFNKLDNQKNQFTLNVVNGMYVIIIRKNDEVLTKKFVVN